MIVLFLIPYAILLTILRGWTISVVWGWFIVPMGAPSIGIAQAIGLSCFASIFTIGLKTDVADQGDEVERVVTAILNAVVSYALILGTAYIVKAFFL
jgi:hypothetical protein